MLHKQILPVILFLFLYNFVTAGSRNKIDCSLITISDSAVSLGNNSEFVLKQRPNPLLQIFRAKQKKNKKITAVLLAFPLPFGIVGLHRIYLGCSPYVPVAYIATLGGIFGILPLIDFFVLLKNKDVDPYSDNSKIFMWVN